MATSTTIPHSRRALLAAAAGGAAALVAGALGRPAPTRAGTDGDVVLGASNSASATTWIQNTANGETVFRASSATGPWPGMGSGIGVHGSSVSGTGVYGSSGGSAGVFGTSVSSFGVRGSSSIGIGVFGDSSSATGVYGLSSSGTGVLGYSGTGSLPTMPAKTGLFGYAIQDSGARGVYGRSTGGRGVYGQATSGTGVWGYATSGYALRANGRVKFDTASGTATIASGTKSETVTSGFDLTTSTKILVTLMGNPGGTTAVHRVAVNTSADSFTIYLTANATADVKVAWLILS